MSGKKVSICPSTRAGRRRVQVLHAVYVASSLTTGGWRGRKKGAGGLPTNNATRTEEENGDKNEKGEDGAFNLPVREQTAREKNISREICEIHYINRSDMLSYEVFISLKLEKGKRVLSSGLCTVAIICISLLSYPYSSAKFFSVPNCNFLNSPKRLI